MNTLSPSPNPTQYPLTATGAIKTKVTYLEMKSLSDRIVQVEHKLDKESVAIKKAEHIEVNFYRELYDRVGATLTWTGRKLVDDITLAKSIHSENTHIHVLYVKDKPAGYIEFIVKPEDKSCELIYFGLIPEFYGNRLGPYLLNWGVKHVFENLGIKRLWLHSCDLDHPKMMSTYLQSGFTKYGEAIEEVKTIE